MPIHKRRCEPALRQALLMSLAEATAGAAAIVNTVLYVRHVLGKSELTFGFVLSGSAKLVFGDAMPISPADAFVIPPRKAWSIAAGSDDFQLLHVTTATLRQFA